MFCQYLEAGPDGCEHLIDFHTHEAPQFAVVFNLVRKVEYRRFAQRPQNAVEAVDETGIPQAEAGDEQPESAKLIAARPEPYRLLPLLLPRGSELGEVVIAVPVDIVPGEPHGPDSVRA